MAFDYTNLYPDTSSNGGYTKSWNYTTVTDNIATCSAPGYFNKVATRLGIGDNIIIARVDAFDTKNRTTLVELGELFVTGIAGGVVTTSASVAFDALSPTTTRGDIIYRNATTNTRLPAGTAGYLLQTNGAGADPSWAGFLQAGTGAVPRTFQDKASERVSVTDFGADPTGVADSTTAIQNAINALPVTGGDVYFPVGTYKISSNLNIGDGSTSQISTKRGIHLVAVGTPTLPAEMISGFPSTGGVKLLWAGGALPMIQINGPLNGWGVSNMYLDGAGVATQGINVVSGAFGQSKNLAITNCLNQIKEATTTTFTGAGGAVGSFHNAYTNIALHVPAIAGATGVVLTGAPTPPAGGATNSSYAHFQNLTIHQPATLNTFGIYLQWTDSPTFDGVHIFGGSATSAAVFFDYTLQNNMPSSCHFYGIDPSGTGTSTQWANAGTPGPGARPNYLHSIGEINLGANPVNIPGLSPDLPKQYGVVSFTGQTAQITNSPLYTPFETGLYRVSYYMKVTAGGTAGTLTFSANYNDGFAASSLSSIPINANGVQPSLVGGDVVFRASAGAAITFSVTFAGVTGSPAYAVFAAVERIG